MKKKVSGIKIRGILATLLVFGPALLLVFIGTRGCEHNFKELDDSLIHHKFDITNSIEISKLDEFDIIFYCSGYGQPQKFCNNPEKTLSNNQKTIKKKNK